MSEGSVVQSGTYQQLMEEKGDFARLVNTFLSENGNLKFNDMFITLQRNRYMCKELIIVSIHVHKQQFHQQKYYS